MAKTAFITGITGQDGSYLAELLLGKGYEVHGLVRRISSYDTHNIDHLRERINLHYGDLTNECHLCGIINEIKPCEVYNLASQSDVKVSFDCPEYTGEVTALGVTRVLEAISKFSPESKLYQAGTSEMFGDSPPPQSEDTPFRPKNPYGAAKYYGHCMAKIYREAYGLFVANGILFNHESPRRGTDFVTRKITKAANSIAEGKQKELLLGNLDAKRDWGYAPDYVKAMWMMLQESEPDDYVIGTGETHTVREFLKEAFNCVGLRWEDFVKTDPRFYRPVEINHLLANPAKAQKKLGWVASVSFKELVKLMMDADKEKKC